MVKMKSARIVILVLMGLLASCYWSRYPQLMDTHLTLLDQYSNKLDAMARMSGGVPVEAWGEFVYPLERAQDFARIAGQRYPEMASLQRFQVVLETYQGLLDDPGLLTGQADLSRLEERRAALVLAVAQARAALASES